MGTLTIKENFMFSANLRLPSCVTTEEKEQRVEETITELGLQLVKDSRVIVLKNIVVSIATTLSMLIRY